MLKNEQKSAKTLPQRLAGLNKGRSAWGENLACGVAWQSVLLGRSGAWQNIANSVWRVFVGKTTHDKFGLASVAKVGGACGRNRRSENGAVFGRRTSLSLSLSLSLVSQLFICDLFFLSL